MTTKTRTAALSIALVLITLGVPALAGTCAARGFVDSPLVIGDQLYSGGELAIYKVGSSELLAVELDGRRVALMYRSQVERRPGQERPRFVLQRDERGFYHLASQTAGQVAPITMASNATGLSTIPDYRPVRPHDGHAIAAR